MNTVTPCVVSGTRKFDRGLMQLRRPELHCLDVSVSSISLEWPSTGVFKAERPSTWWTAAHSLPTLPAVSIFAVSVTTSSSFHYIVTSSSVVGRFLLSARWLGTLCMTIFMTQCLVMTSLEQHSKHTFLQVSEHGRSAIVLYKCTITYLLHYSDYAVTSN